MMTCLGGLSQSTFRHPIPLRPGNADYTHGTYPSLREHCTQNAAFASSSREWQCGCHPVNPYGQSRAINVSHIGSDGQPPLTNRINSSRISTATRLENQGPPSPGIHRPSPRVLRISSRHQYMQDLTPKGYFPQPGSFPIAGSTMKVAKTFAWSYYSRRFSLPESSCRGFNYHV